MARKFANNAVSTLAAAIAANATSLSVVPGAGAKYPALAAGDIFSITVLKADGSLEVMAVTARTNDTFTVLRAQEGTAALAFAAGDRVESRWTAASADAMFQKSGGDITGGVTQTGFDSGNGQFRTISGNYGCFWRNDGNALYLMSTASGDTRGSYNGYRPIRYTFADGALYLSGAGQYTFVGGALLVTGAIEAGRDAAGDYAGIITLRSRSNQYSPAIRANAANGSMEFVNNGSTAVNATMSDSGAFWARGNISTSGTVTGSSGVASGGPVWAVNAQFATDGNSYGSVWGNEWLSNWLNSQLNARAPVRAGFGGFGYIMNNAGNSIYQWWDGSNVVLQVDSVWRGAILDSTNYSNWAASRFAQCPHNSGITESGAFAGGGGQIVDMGSPWVCQGMRTTTGAGWQWMRCVSLRNN